MQLIQPTEPAPIDIKKTMSALEESLEDNQINGVIADIVSDVSTKISNNKTVSKPHDDENGEQKEVKDLNGIVKTNGASQNECEVSELDKTEPDVKENSANGQSNGNLLSEPCKSPVSALADNSDIDNKIDLGQKNISGSTEENIVNENDKNVDSAEQLISDSAEDIKENVVTSNAIEETEENIVSENDKNVDSVEKLISDSAEDTKENVVISNSIEETEEIIVGEIDKNINSAEKLISDSAEDIKENVVTSNSIKDIEDDIVTSETKLTEVPKLTLQNNKDNSSENVDALASGSNEEILDVNNSDQLKLVTEDNALIEQDITKSNTVTERPKEIVNNIINANEPNEVPSIAATSENNDDIISEQQIKDKLNDPIDDDFVDSIEAPIENIDKILDTLNAEDNLTSDITEIQDSIYNTNDIKAVSIADPEKLSVENDNKMSNNNIDKSEPEIKTTQEKGDKVEPAVESKQKYNISVKSITDMTSPTSSANETTQSSDTNKDSIKQESEIENKSMEVDEADVSIVIPENDILNPTDTLSAVQNDSEIDDKNNSDMNSIEASKDENLIKILKKDDNVVMEIDDTDDVTFIEKSSFESEVDKRSKENGTGDDVKYSENSEKEDAVIDIIDNDDDDKSNESENKEVKNDETSEVISIEDNVKDADLHESKKSSEIEEKNFKVIESNSELKVGKSRTPVKTIEKELPVYKLSNNMDILSDEEDEPPVVKPTEEKKSISEELKTVEDQNKCINIDDDDDIMFIEESNSPSPQESNKEETKEHVDNKIDLNETEVEKVCPSEKPKEEASKIIEKDDSSPKEVSEIHIETTKPVEPTVIEESKPIITRDFLKSVTKNLADMTRNELEDFCILKLVESVVDKSNLNEIKNKMKTMAQTIEELRKKALSLTKQNRDLQVVVKTVQEDQKKRNSTPMMPMKITRSVGMQVVLTPSEKVVQKRKLTAPPPFAQNKTVRNNQNVKTQKPPVNIPVPRLVPASSPTVKSPVTANTAAKPTNKTTPQRPEKRPHSKVSPASSVTVDLTDDEPPTKVNPKPPVRLVPSQNLMAPKTRPQFGQQSNSSPRKVYIPISSTNQNVRPGTAVLRNFAPSPRGRQPAVVRMQAVRLQTPTPSRHPAPLPDAMKQYQPPAWKALPPAPDLKLSKVDNGIVISWKFEGYQPDSYEEVASFQLYAYQETPAPPSTALWKKIGDIKALPLPMACTLTQFMSGFKYYFAVRAIDVRSRIGPFSLPGSIMLIHKN